jgi:hypothetical protein
MPLYSFIHPDTEEEIEVIQKMAEPHVYIDEQGVEWKRKWTLPNAQIDAQIDPFDKKAFSRKLDHKQGTLGEIFDQSRELSEKRKNKLGYDPVKKKNLEEYSKKRMGRKPPTMMEE